MATTTQHTLSYKLLMDTKQFDKNTEATKKQLVNARREMRAMLTPTEKYELALEKLSEAKEQDARLQEVYNRKMQQYREHLAKIRTQESKLTKVRTRLNTSAAGIVGVLGAGALLRRGKQQIELINEMGKKAKQLGIDISKLNEIQFVTAKQTALTQDQAAKAIEKFTRRITEAANGTGEAKAQLEKYNINAAELIKMAPDEAFWAVGDAIKDLTSKQDALLLGTKLFDDEQAQMIEVLLAGRNAFEQQAEKARGLGAVLTELDVQKAEQAADAMTDLGVTFDAFSRQFTTAFAPAITKVMDTITKFIERNYGDGQAAGLGVSTLQAGIDAGPQGGLLGIAKNPVFWQSQVIGAMTQEALGGQMQGQANRAAANQATLNHHQRLQQEQLNELRQMNQKMARPVRTEEPAI